MLLMSMKVAMKFRYILLLLSAVSGSVGLGLQFGASKESSGVNVAIRSLYLFAALPSAYVTLQFLLHWLLTMIQYFLLQSLLFSLADIAHCCSALITFILALPYQQMLYSTSVLCKGDRQSACNHDDLDQARYITWRILVCLIIASSVDLGKSTIARVIFSTVYGAKQYAKMRKVLEQEILIRSILNKPRVRLSLNGTHQLTDSSISTQSLPFQSLNMNENHINYRTFVPLALSAGSERSKELRAEVLQATKKMLIEQHLLRGKSKQVKLQSQVQAATIANEIRAVLMDTEGGITVNRIQEVMQLPSRDAAKEVIELLDVNNDGIITYFDIERVVSNIFYQRANLAATLHDMEKVTHTLECAIAVLLHVALIPAYLAVWNVDIWQFATTLGAILLASAFVFGETLKRSFEGVLFLFVDCHYQVGDVLQLDLEGLCRVKSMTLTYTELQKENGERLLVRTSKLADSEVRNWSRIPQYTECISVDIDATTFSPTSVSDVISDLRKHSNRNLADISRDSICSETVTIVHGLKVRIEFKWTYAFSPEDINRYQVAKSSMLGALSEALVKYGFTCQEAMVWKHGGGSNSSHFDKIENRCLPGTPRHENEYD